MADHTVESATEFVRQHADVVRGHDAVHPDRDACGGIGGCGLMRAEHEAEQRVIDTLSSAASRGLRLAVVEVSRG